ncbi:MAG: hypothetical protein WCR24_07535 [Candidatus Methanomethylophilaceae archaeon]
MKTNTTTIGVRVSDSELVVIQDEISKGKAINASDFLRQAVREKIAKVKA